MKICALILSIYLSLSLSLSPITNSTTSKLRLRYIYALSTSRTTKIFFRVFRGVWVIFCGHLTTQTTNTYPNTLPTPTEIPQPTHPQAHCHGPTINTIQTLRVCRSSEQAGRSLSDYHAGVTVSLCHGLPFPIMMEKQVSIGQGNGMV